MASPPHTITGSGPESTDNLIVDGASSILLSYSNFILLINESELSSKYGFNFKKALDIIDNTTEKLSVAREIYFIVMIQYKQNTIDIPELHKLKEFNYDALVQERKLHASVMDKVRLFLEAGDLVGFFEKIVEDTNKIIVLLKSLRQKIQSNTIPDIEELRILYQQFSDYMLFGYYSSLVFSELKDRG